MTRSAAAGQLPLDFDAATKAANEGIERSAARANRVESEWTGQALGFLSAVGLELPDFTIEEAREICERRGLPVPTDKRAWGQVTRTALMKKRIEPTGERRKTKNSHGCKKDVYRLTRGRQ